MVKKGKFVDGERKEWLNITEDETSKKKEELSDVLKKVDNLDNLIASITAEVQGIEVQNAQAEQ